jgi:hypothetical protein
MSQNIIKDDYIGEPKTKDMSVKKPRVRGIVILLFLKAILYGLLVIHIQSVINNTSFIVEWWALPLSYALLGLAGAGWIAVILIALYKRLGLILGGAIVGLELLLNLLLTIGASATEVNYLPIFINIYILWYIYKYVNHQPENTFFS